VLKKIYESTKTIDVGIGSTTKLYWISSVDAMFTIGTITNANEVLRIYRDGSVVRFGQFSFNGDGTDFASAPEFNDLLVLSGSRGGWFPLHEQSWTPNLQKPFTSAVTAANADFSVVLRNRAGVLKHLERFGKGYRVRNIDTDAVEDTVEIYTGGFNLDRGMHWVYDKVILAARSDGKIYLWDTDTKTLLLESNIDVPNAICVDTENQNLMAIRSSDKIVQIYDLAIEPDSISAITATPNNFERYHNEALSVTVLGSNSEPVEGVLVEWSAVTVGPSEGAVNGNEVNSQSVNAGHPVSPSKGKISPSQSFTNAAGVATATYCPPGLDWVSGDQDVITATVRT
jgi:hypothetical protein